MSLAPREDTFIVIGTSLDTVEAVERILLTQTAPFPALNENYGDKHSLNYGSEDSLNYGDEDSLNYGYDDSLNYGYEDSLNYDDKDSPGLQMSRRMPRRLSKRSRQESSPDMVPILRMGKRTLQ